MHWWYPVIVIPFSSSEVHLNVDFGGSWVSESGAQEGAWEMEKETFRTESIPMKCKNSTGFSYHGF